MVLLSGCEMRTGAYPSVCGVHLTPAMRGLLPVSTQFHERARRSTIPNVHDNRSAKPTCLPTHHPSAYGVQDLCVHQTETGRPVTDAVVQEVCKLRPDMIGLSLRDCVEVGPYRRYFGPQFAHHRARWGRGRGGQGIGGALLATIYSVSTPCGGSAATSTEHSWSCEQSVFILFCLSSARAFLTHGHHHHHKSGRPFVCNFRRLQTWVCGVWRDTQRPCASST